MIWMGWEEVCLLLLAVGSELLKVDLLTYSARERSAVSFGLAATFLILAYQGVEAAVVAALLQAAVVALINTSVWYKAIFNAGLFTSATYLAGVFYVVLGGRAEGWGSGVVLASLLSAVAYFFVQSLCVSAAISFSSGRRFRSIWSDSFGWMVLQQALTGMIGLLLGRFMALGMTFIGVLLLGSPLIMLRHSYRLFANRTQRHLGEMEQANADLARLNHDLRTANAELIRTLGTLLDARDRYTFGHSAQVATYAVAIGEKMGMSTPDLELLHKAALLHDIGKVGVPEGLLMKAGRLDEQERRVMQAHAEIGYRIVSQVGTLQGVAEMIRQHHEWYGGGGYPEGRRGDQILLAARIISVADALDTIASDRPYRKGQPAEVALSELRRCSGTQFDPAVVAALEQVFRERGGTWFAGPGRVFGYGALALEVAAAGSDSAAR